MDRIVATGSDDGSTKLWSFNEKEANLKATLTPPTHDRLPVDIDERLPTLNQDIRPSITTLAMSPFDPILVTASKDASIMVWSLEQPGRCLGGLPSGNDDEEGHEAVRHQDFVNTLEWSHYGQFVGMHVLSCSDDATAKIWDVGKGSQVHELHQDQMCHTAAIPMATYNHDCSTILTCSHDRTCIIWSSKNGRPMRQIPTSSMKADKEQPHSGPIWSANWCSDSHAFVTASRDKRAKLWDSISGRCMQTLSDPKTDDRTTHNDAVLGAIFSPSDNRQILTYSLDNTFKLWDAKSNKVAQLFDQHSAAVWQCVFGSDAGPGGNNILSCSHDMTALVYDQRLGLPKHTLSGHAGILWQASFSDDERWVVTCSEDRTAKIWDLSSGARRPHCHTLGDVRQTKHTQAVTCAAIQARSQPAHLADHQDLIARILSQRSQKRG